MLTRTLALAVAAAALVFACGDEAGVEAPPTEAPSTPTAAASAATTTPTSTARIAPATNDAARPTDLPALPGGASGFTHFVFERVGEEIVTSLVEGPRDAQVRARLSLPALRDLLASDEPVPEELQMTRDEVGALVSELDEILRELHDEAGERAK